MQTMRPHPAFGVPLAYLDQLDCSKDNVNFREFAETGKHSLSYGRVGGRTRTSSSGGPSFHLFLLLLSRSCGSSLSERGRSRFLSADNVFLLWAKVFLLAPQARPHEQKRKLTLCCRGMHPTLSENRRQFFRTSLDSEWSNKLIHVVIDVGWTNRVWILKNIFWGRASGGGRHASSPA